MAECARHLLAPGNWEERIGSALPLLGQALGTSRAMVFETETSPDGIVLTHIRYSWAAPGVSTLLDDPAFKSISLRVLGLSRWEASFRSGREVAMSLARAPLADRARLRTAGALSVAVLPIFARGEWWGCLSFHECKHSRTWPESTLKSLRVAAALIGAAIERERGDGALKESEERFKRLASCSFEGIAITEKGVFLEASPRLATMLGCDTDEIPGRRAIDFVAPEDRRIVAEKMSGGEEGPYSHTLIRPDGSSYPVEVRAKDMPYRGRVVRVTALLDISERFRSAQALRDSERRYRDIFEFAPVGIYQSVPDGTIIAANLAYARMLGYDTVEEVMGLSLVRDVYAEPGDRARLIARYGGVGHGAGVEVKLKRRDGGVFWAEMAAHAVKDASGDTLYFETFITDITARKAAEAELRESEEHYRRLFEENPTPMVIYELGSLRFLAVNAAAVALYGYSKEDFLSRTITSVVVPEDVPRVLAAQRQDRPAMEHRGTRRHLKSDASVVEVDVTSLAITFKGSPARLIVAHDFTEERLLQSAVQRAALDWERTFDATEVCLVLLDSSRRVIRMNKSARSLLGPKASLEAPEMDGTKEPWRAALRALEEAARTGASSTGRAKDRGTGATWELTVDPMPGEAGEGRAILAIRDITRLVELQESLQHEEMVSALGTLVGGVAHEVRNPLFSISATLDDLEGQFGADPGYVRCAGLLRAQVARLSELMHDLLEYGKSPNLRKAPVNPGDLVRRAARACVLLARERGVEVLERVSPELPLMNVDAARVEQVLQNLIANAIQHSPRSSRVLVMAKAPLAGHVTFAVEDSGDGIPEKDLPRLFMPFFTRRKGGTGLGLSIVQRIVEAHGGLVEAGNRPEGGAVFTVSLPVSHGNAAA